MNRREFFRLAGVFVAGTMIQPQIPINWFYEPPARPAPTMPTRYVMVDRRGEQLAKGCFDNFICGQYSDGTMWTEVEEFNSSLSAREIVFCQS